MQRLYERGIEVPVRQILMNAIGHANFSIWDLHTHGKKSHDVDWPNGQDFIETYRTTIRNRGINGIVLTDHNIIPDSNLPVRVVPGSELSPLEGHVNINGMNRAYTDALRDYYGVEAEKSGALLVKPTRLEGLFYLQFDFGLRNERAPSLAFPHPFRGGGVLFDKTPEEINAFYKLWKSYFGKQPCLLEWTNSVRSPDSKAASKVLECVRDSAYNFQLVAGSDSHSRENLGLAGIVVMEHRISFEDVKRAVLLREYLVYHMYVSAQDSPTGSLMITTPKGEKRVDYSIRFTGNQWTVTKTKKYNNKKGIITLFSAPSR